MKTGLRSVLIAVVLTACDSGGGTLDGDDDGSVNPGEEDGGTPNDARVMNDGSSRDARVPREAMPPPPNCGDNNKGGIEECDDGNVDDGDGCSSQCTKEEGFNCPAGSGACATICGDGLLVLGEACDDANVVSADGCSDTCQLESGWVCLGSGMGTCVSAGCGDGVIVGTETCDDGDAIPGDGCGTACAMEAGYLCPVPGMPCVAERCGDGVRAGAEACDDGETAGMTKSGDGCTSACDAVEPNYACPDQGGPCTRTTICGNGVLTSDEQCDDRNTANGDGCSASCRTEPGWQCTTVGRACTATRCGDMVVAGSEQCEDGNSTANDGCTACKIDAGWACTWTNGVSACHRARCGDGMVEGNEACDDGNTVAGDGCSPFNGDPAQPFGGNSALQCKFEPTCAVGQPCISVCGDGIRLPADTTEECDDGNRRNGDGCSSSCKEEAGYVCRNVTSTLPASFPLTVTYRDFISLPTTAASGAYRPGIDQHPDFNTFGGSDASYGMVNSSLVNGKPDYNNKCENDGSVAAGCGGGTNTDPQSTSKARFDEWYSNGAPASVQKFVTSMTMTRVGTTGNYRNPTFNASLFPLDSLGWVSGTSPKENRSDDHNFGFTTEIRHWFQFTGGEVLSFSGDDDVWVFIAGKLVLDLGGLHSKQSRTITLNTNANGGVSCYNDTASEACATASVNAGLVAGNVYEMALFHAERHTNQSNFDLTLNGFTAPLSVCTAVCGDGVITAGEICDEGSMCAGGTNNGAACYLPQAQRQTGDTVECNGSGAMCSSKNTNSYGGCKADCSDLGPHCGDSIKQGNEACDLGSALNTGSYNGCTADCKAGPKCGDSKVDGFYMEQCDLGTAGNVGGYGGCAANCRFAERCGDGTVQADEQCDDGQNRSAYGGCGPGCKLAPSCGDTVVQSARGEQCDLGAGNNTGAYGGCTSECKKAARCGDRVLDEADGEECDDGNLNNFDGCSKNCQRDTVI
jgi:fibro-slime domain-containing protein